MREIALKFAIRALAVNIIPTTPLSLCVARPDCLAILSADSSRLVLAPQAMDSRIWSEGNCCGRGIVITRTSTGKSIQVTCWDECPTCDSAGSLDLSTGAFTQLGTLDEGVCESSLPSAVVGNRS